MQAYIEKQRAQGPAPTASIPPFVTSDIVDAVQKALKEIKPFDSWHDVQDRAESEQKELWLFREWLHCEIALHVANTIERSKDTVQFGDKRRKIPPGFKIGDYKVLSFGSLSLTSDIDMTIDGPKGSFLVACVEDAWYEITGHTSLIWDIEYYGDFLMFHNGSDFINSRTFGAEEDATKILSFAGVGILKNGVSLEHPAIQKFLDEHSILRDNHRSDGWIARAKKIYATIEGETDHEMREHYYSSLADAEAVRDTADLSARAKHLRAFIALAQANLYRHEGYILPSTVIHVVRDIQAKSAPARESECAPFTAKLASCALGPFTYACSALEQLGYMLRFEGKPKKEEKYKKRLDDALEKMKMFAKGGASKRSTRRRRNALQKTKHTKGSSRGRMASAKRARL